MSSLTTDAVLGPHPAEPSAPFPHVLLPAFARRALVRRILRRAEARALARLRETSAHLLDDVGQPDREGPGRTLGWQAGRPNWTAPDHWLR